jgi:hypothetical protein
MASLRSSRLLPRKPPHHFGGEPKTVCIVVLPTQASLSLGRPRSRPKRRPSTQEVRGSFRSVLPIMPDSDEAVYVHYSEI